jgi:O-antigen/teichoic acid export membrane protein
VGQSASKIQLKSLFIFGGWISVSNLISPMMVYFDRFYIAAILSASVIAFYTTPFDLLTKLLFIPAALVGVMFASFSTDWLGNPKLVIARYKWSLFVVFATMLPIMLVTSVYAFEGMSWWLGSDFAQQSYQIVQWLSVGVLLNALAMVPFAFIQATGRADITAKIHLLELPVYVLLLWIFMDEFGLLGAAMAWTIRVAVDLFVLFFVALLLQNRHSMLRSSL